MHLSHIGLFLQVVMRSSPHSLSSVECEEGKQYHEKMQFAHSIIENIYRSRSYVVKFLQRQKRGWSSREEGGPRATLVDPIQI
jgi:hypothetical protein